MKVKQYPIQQIFPNNLFLIIGEVAQTHDGSLGMAHAFIDAIAKAGAQAVKFQTHIAEAESTPGEPWRVKFSKQDRTRFEYWKRMEFSEEQWAGLKQHADERGLLFISSPFSFEAVDLLKRVGVAAWKVASGEVTNTPMFERMAEFRIPFLLSTGMSTLAEIDQGTALIQAKDLPLAVLQCTSMYPTPPEKVGLNLIPFFADRYTCPVGLSDHSGTIYPSLAAVTLGVTIFEVHVTFDRSMFGPDVPVSITFNELAQLVEGVRNIQSMRSNPVDKDSMAKELKAMRDLFTKSIVARSDLPAGTVLRTEHLTVKKPGTGIPASRLKEFIGKTLVRVVNKDEFLQESDIGK